MTVGTIQLCMIAGLIGLELVTVGLLRAFGYWEQGIQCPRCHQVHVPPRFYRAPHQPKEDWQALDRQCSRPSTTIQ